MTDGIKEELIFIINTKINKYNLTTRQVIQKFKFLNSMMLNRLTHYNIESFKVDKLIDIINNIDKELHGKISGFSLNIKDKTLTLSYLGQL
jgi:predicted XRE-type DNA-binding protein